jgi:hypothetical protein
MRELAATPQAPPLGPGAGHGCGKERKLITHLNVEMYHMAYYRPKETEQSNYG